MEPTSIILADSQSLGAAGRLRVTTPKIQEQVKFDYNRQLHTVKEFTEGGATIIKTDNESTLTLTVPAVADARAIKQTRHIQYIPFNSQNPVATHVFGPIVPGVIKRVGMFDDNNGTFLEQNGVENEYYIVSRTSTSGTPIDDPIPRNRWDDTLAAGAGNNPTGTHFDFEKFAVNPLDFLWLGGGRIRWASNIDGKNITFHTITHAGKLDSPYWATAALPLRCEIINVTGANAASMKLGCMAVHSEGGEELFGVEQIAKRDFYNKKTIIDTSATTLKYQHLLSVRPKQQFNGLDYRGYVIPVEFAFFVDGNFPIEFVVVHDSNLTTAGGSPILDAKWIDVYGGTIQPSASEMLISTVGDPVDDILLTDTGAGHPHNWGWATGLNKGQTTSGSEFRAPVILTNGIDISDRTESDTYSIFGRALGGSPSVACAMKLAEVY